MGRLSDYEQFIHLPAFEVRKHAKVNAHPHEGKEVHGLLGRDAMRVGKDPVGAADMVVNGFRLLLEKSAAGVFLVLDDLGEHFIQSLDNVSLSFAKSHLVGDLEDVPKGFGTFTVKSTDGQTELIDGLNDLIDLLSQNQPRKVQHRTHPDTGTEIRGAGG